METEVTCCVKYWVQHGYQITVLNVYILKVHNKECCRSSLYSRLQKKKEYKIKSITSLLSLVIVMIVNIELLTSCRYRREYEKDGCENQFIGVTV